MCGCRRACSSWATSSNFSLASADRCDARTSVQVEYASAPVAKARAVVPSPVRTTANSSQSKVRAVQTAAMVTHPGRNPHDRQAGERDQQNLAEPRHRPRKRRPQCDRPLVCWVQATGWNPLIGFGGTYGSPGLYGSDGTNTTFALHLSAASEEIALESATPPSLVATMSAPL